MCMFGPIKHAAMNTVPGKVRFVQHRLKRQLSKTDTATYPKKKEKKAVSHAGQDGSARGDQ